MNFYLVTRTDDVDYDEYDSVVVKASNKEEAIITAQICSRQFEKKNVTVTLLEASGKAEVVLGSFNAG